MIAVLFHRYVEAARGLMIGAALAQDGFRGKVLVVLVPMVVFAVLALLVRRFAPRALGANLARVRMAYSSDSSLLGPRSVSATFLATPVSLGAGAPLGPEGPIVVVTSGVSAALGRYLRLPDKLTRGMIPVGVAAGIAAIFNTPITGVVFAMEEVIGNAERGLLGGVIVGAVSAAVVERTMLGGRPLLAAPFASWSDPRELLGFAIVGLAAGAISGYAISGMHRLKRWLGRRMPSMVVRAAAAGAAIGLIGLVAPSILGVGYDSISLWLHGGGTVGGTGLAFGAKTIAFVIAVSSGVIGGTFAPSLFMGAALGATIGHAAHTLFPGAGIDPRAYALLGMGSFFAGLLRSPIAAVLIVIELTRDYDLIVPLMLAVSLSVAISRRISPSSIVEQQMRDEGYVETHDSFDPIAGVRVTQAMTHNPTTFRSDMPIGDCARVAAAAGHRIFPVCDENGRLVGIVSRNALDLALSGDEPVRLVGEIAEVPRLVVSAGDLVIDVVGKMRVAAVDRSVVIDDEDSKNVVGFLSPSDILRVRMDSPAPSDGAFEIFE